MNTESDRLRVLVVDDEEPFRRIIEDLLASGGSYEVETCESGEEAELALMQELFDVIILDYKMPGISGLNVLQWMHEQKLDTPVIMLTAAGSEHVAVEAMKLGAYDYQRKEQIDIDHLPILINGVHERYLFRKEKQRREQLEHDRQSLPGLKETALSLGLGLKNALTMLTLSLNETENALRSRVDDSGREALAKAFKDLRMEADLISTSANSVLSLLGSAAELPSGWTKWVEARRAPKEPSEREMEKKSNKES